MACSNMYKSKIRIIKESSEQLIKISDFKTLLRNEAVNLFQLIEDRFKLGGTAYTYYEPTSLDFTQGIWADYSPTIFKLSSNDQIDKILISCVLYYNLFPNTLPMTLLWIEKISSLLSEDIEIWQGKNWGISYEKDYMIKLIFPERCARSIREFLNHCYEEKTTINIEKLKSSIDLKKPIKNNENVYMFNFRAVKNYCSNVLPPDLIKEFNEMIESCGYESFAKDSIKKFLESEFSKGLTNLFPPDTSLEKISAEFVRVFLRLFLIGHEPPKFIRILVPKVIHIKDYRMGLERDIGLLGGILRIYDDNVSDNITKSIFVDGFPFLLSFSNKIAETFLRRVGEKHALRSAMSAIMARNMSHNIGSHVFSDLVATGLPMGDDMQRNFLRYNQHRMDFIAQITTEIPSWTYPAWFHKEIMREFYNQYLLIDRIGVSEGLRAYEWPEDPSEGDMRGKIIIRTATETKDNGDDSNTPQKRSGESPSQSEGNCPTGFKWIVNEYRKPNDSKDEYGDLKDDFQIAVPAGIVGYHALYVIIEDFLRNEAKHNYLKRIKFEEDMKRILIIPGAEKGIDHIVSKGYPVDEGKDKPRIYVDIVPLSKISEIDGIKYNFCIVCDEKVENNDIIEKMPKDKKMSKDRISKKSNLRESLKEKINALCAGNIPQDNNIKELIKELRKNDIFIIQNDSYQTFDTISCLVALDKLKEFPYYKAIIVDGINNNIEKLTKKIMEKQYPPERIFIFGEDSPEEPEDNKLKPHYLTKKESEYVKSLLKKIKEKKEDADIYIKKLEKYLSDIPLRINIKIEEDQNDRDIYWITIWSDMPHKVKFRKTPNSKEKKDFIYEMLNAYLKRSFINDDGSIRKENWGLQEMKICAGFLQQRSVLEIGAEGESIIDIEKNDEKTGLPRGIIKCIPVNRKGNDIKKEIDKIVNESKKNDGKGKDNEGKIIFYYTGFRFWVKKNKEVYVVKGDNNGRGQK